MKSRVLITASAPVFLGALLLVVVFVDLAQFSSGTIEVRIMLSREVPIVILGLISSLVAFGLGLYSLTKGYWRNAFLLFASSMTFLISFTIAGLNGGAFLNAT